MNLKDCALIDLPKFADPRGSLSFIEAGHHIPFEIKRVFYLYDVPTGQRRAGHALKKCHQLLVAISGYFDVTVDDGRDKGHYHLDQPSIGLHIPPVIWRELENFSPGAVCMALASEFYDPADYYRAYSEFRTAVGGAQK